MAVYVDNFSIQEGGKSRAPGASSSESSIQIKLRKIREFGSLHAAREAAAAALGWSSVDDLPGA
jgi:hypothetical protein